MKTSVTVLIIIALAATFAALLVEWPKPADEIPAGGPQQTYPWQIEVIDGGAGIRVFGLVPGRTTLADAMARFGEEAQVALFRTTGDRYTVEAYFSHIEVGKLLGKLVLTLDAVSGQVDQWMDRGREKTISESGSLKVVPAGKDRPAIDRLVLSSLAFLPMVRLDADTLTMRFGEPGRRYKDDNGVEHWVWPAKGLNIALHQGRTKDVLQYQAPGQMGDQAGDQAGGRTVDPAADQSPVTEHARPADPKPGVRLTAPAGAPGR